jgi:hypothetical protein
MKYYRNPNPPRTRNPAVPDHAEIRALAKSLSKPFFNPTVGVPHFHYLYDMWTRYVTYALAVNRAAEGYLLFAIEGMETPLYRLTEAVERFADFTTDNKAAIDRLGAYSDDYGSASRLSTALHEAAALLRLYQDAGRHVSRIRNPRR